MENRLNMESRFIREQEKLLSSIQLKNEVNINELQYVAGVDVAYWKEIDVEYAVCCIVVIDYQSQEVIERQCYKGRVVRTHKDVKPIFLSIGNKIDIDTATNIIMRLVTKDSHIPIPTRYADIMTHEMRKKYQEK